VPLVGGLAGPAARPLLGYVSRPRRRHHLCDDHAGLGELVFAMSLMLPEFFGGEGGISSNRVVGKPVFGHQLRAADPGVLPDRGVLLHLHRRLMFALTRTPLGRMLNAVRDNPERVEFIGYDTQLVRYMAFIISGFFAGIAGGLGALNFEIVTAEVVGAALGRLPAVHLPRRRHLLLRAHHRRRADGAGRRAAVRAHQGLAAVPGPRLPVHGDVCARRLCQPDHDEPARGRLRQVAPAVDRPYLALAGTRPVLAGAAAMIEMVYHLQLNAALGPQLRFIGMTLNSDSVDSWFGAAFVP
jgi:branched-chain amino acid transport system permease protein